MKNVGQCFDCAYRRLASGSVSFASDPVEMLYLKTNLSQELDIFFKGYRSFINPKYRFASARTKLIADDFEKLQREFFNTLFFDRFLDGKMWLFTLTGGEGVTAIGGKQNM